MTIRQFLLAAGLMTLLPAAQAQDTAQEEDETEEIIVRAEGYPRDRAMEAFNAGDFETAEIEFEANFQCAQRIETLSQFQQDAARAEAAAASPPPSPNDPGGTPQSVPRQQSYSGPERTEETLDRTCEDKAFQLYMLALSQIKLGKVEEAKANLTRVIRLAKGIDAYDAHYRLALIALLEDDMETAERRLSHLKTLQDRCTRRGDRCEQREELDQAVAYLDEVLEAKRADG